MTFCLQDDSCWHSLKETFGFYPEFQRPFMRRFRFRMSLKKWPASPLVSRPRTCRPAADGDEAPRRTRSKNPLAPRVFGFWNVSWTCRSNFLGLFPQKARGHPILTKKITLLCELLCCIMRDVISTNMLRFLWTSRQSVYFSKSGKCKSLVGRVRREKKSFNVSPQSLFPFSVSIQTSVWLFACTLMRKNTDCFTVYLLYY